MDCCSSCPTVLRLVLRISRPVLASLTCDVQRGLVLTSQRKTVRVPYASQYASHACVLLASFARPACATGFSRPPARAVTMASAAAQVPRGDPTSPDPQLIREPRAGRFGSGTSLHSRMPRSNRAESGDCTQGSPDALRPSPARSTTNCPCPPSVCRASRKLSRAPDSLVHRGWYRICHSARRCYLKLRKRVQYRERFRQRGAERRRSLS